MSRSGFGTFARTTIAALAVYWLGSAAIDNLPSSEGGSAVSGLVSRVQSSIAALTGGSSQQEENYAARELSTQGTSAIAEPAPAALPETPSNASGSVSSNAPVQVASGSAAETVSDAQLERLHKLLAETSNIAVPKSEPGAATAAADVKAEEAGDGVSVASSESTQVAAAEAQAAEVVEAETEAATSALPSVVLSFGEMNYVDEGDESGKVALSGRSEPGASLRVLVDGDKLGKAEADAQGNWSFSTDKALAVGPHWIVVEQLDDKGDTVARAESPFDRAEPAVKPAEPVVAQAEAPVEPVASKPAEEAAAAANDGTTGDAAKAESETATAGDTRPDETAKVQPAEAGKAAPAEAAKADAGTPAAEVKANAETATAEAPSASAMSGEENKSEAAGGMAADSTQVAEPDGNKPDKRGIGLKQTATKLWDKFTGIFTVDPSELRRGTDAETAQKSGQDTAGAGDPVDTSGEPSAMGTQAVDATTGQAGGVGSSVPGLSFMSVTHRTGRSGDALRLAGFASPGSRIRLFDGDDKVGEVVADNQGAWSFVRRGRIASGQHMFRAGRVANGGRIDAEVRMQYDHLASDDAGKSVKAVAAAKTEAGGKEAAAVTRNVSPGKAGERRISRRQWRAIKQAEARRARRAAHSSAGKARRARTHGAYAVGRAAKAAGREARRSSRSRVRVHTPKSAKASRTRGVRVIRGDTLSRLERRLCPDGAAEVYRVATGKKIRSRDLIHAGEKLVIICA